jgi:hypothetical protein
MEFDPNCTKAIDINDPQLDILVGDDELDDVPAMPQLAQQQQSKAVSDNVGSFNTKSGASVVTIPARPSYDGEFDPNDYTPL